MLELIAQGKTIDDRWRRKIPPNYQLELGRATDSYRVPWDSQVSRHHVTIVSAEHKIEVTRRSSAANPVFFNGEAHDSFTVEPGQHFVIGSTTFLLTADQAFGSMSVPSPFSQKTFTSDVLEKVKYRDADRRIEVLNRIPKVIANANDTHELLMGMINTLMAGIATATTIGIVKYVQLDATATEPVPADARPLTVTAQTPSPALQVIQWDRRGFDRGDFQPSEKLVAQAVDTDQSVLNVWHPELMDASHEYTFDYENDWAFACPIESDATRGWSIYVAGRNRQTAKSGSTVSQGSSEPVSLEELDLDGDIKFCELVGSTLKNLLQVQSLERQQASLRNFFSPVVVEAIRARNADDVLLPRECDVTVLFCDLRGFAKTSEAMANDLLGLLERVSESLGITTGKILDQGGVIGDFHGDAVMGFWGWPLSETTREGNAAAAITAAIEIQQAFQQQLHRRHPRLGEFHVGLGMASGHAVAGKIGTRDQVKVTAFGPVVNLASRLEGMTRRLNSMILADRDTMERGLAAETHLSGLTPPPVTRWLGTFQPFGLQRTVDVFQVFPPASDQPGANDHRPPAAAIEAYESAVSQFSTGQWREAIQTLQTIPSEDSARVFLESIIQGNLTPPADFDGVIRMNNK